MFLNPKKMIEQGVLKNVKEKNIQPNAVDLPAVKIEKIIRDDIFSITFEGKKHRRGEPIPFMEGDKLILREGEYRVESDVFCEIPEGIVGWIRPRSTLNRNGILIMSGIYDSGFRNYVGFTLYVKGKMEIEYGIPLAQLILAESDSYSLYDGDYNLK